jgi:hypothetical protein
VLWTAPASPSTSRAARHHGVGSASLTLALLAPVIGEVLFGAVPLSLLPFGLLGLIGLYGGGALLVREIVRGRGLSSAWLVWLGIAYGILEEGTVVQSLFDQHYRGLDFLGFYGHATGVNWVWALFIVPYHAVFSVAIPILLTELLFPDHSQARWLGPAGVIGASTAFTLNAAGLALLQTKLLSASAPQVSLGANLAALAIAGALIAGAFVVRPADAANSPTGRPAGARRLWWVACLGGLAWFIGFRVLIIGTGTNMSAPLACACGLLIAGGIVWGLSAGTAGGPPLARESTYALVAGALPTSWLLGFVIAAVSGGNPVLNLAGHVLFGIAMFWGLRRLRRRLDGPLKPDIPPPITDPGDVPHGRPSCT